MLQLQEMFSFSVERLVSRACYVLSFRPSTNICIRRKICINSFDIYCASAPWVSTTELRRGFFLGNVIVREFQAYRFSLMISV